MEEILKDINAVVGVTGCFVCDDEGGVLAHALTGMFDARALASVGRTVAQTIAGLETTGRRKVGDIDLLYDQGRLIIKNLGEGCVCILCVRRMNVPLLNLTANVAVKKLSEKLKQSKPLQTWAPSPSPGATVQPGPQPAPVAAQPVPQPVPAMAAAPTAEEQPTPQPEPAAGPEPPRRTRAEIMAASLRSR